MGRDRDDSGDRPVSPARRRLSRSETLARLQTHAGAVVDAAGLDLVELRLHGGPRGGRKLQLFIDRWPGEGAVSVEDCASVSRKLGATLEVEEPALGAFDLEVSSPGMNRLLRGTDDMRRFAGVRARVTIETTEDGEDRKETVIGTLSTCDDATLQVQLESGAVRTVQRRSIVRAVLDPTLEQWTEMGRKQATAHDAGGAENREPAEEGTMAQGEVR